MKVIVHVQKFVDVAARGADINAYALVGRGIKAGSMVSAKLAETNGSIIGMLSQNIPKSKKFSLSCNPNALAEYSFWS